MKDSYSFDRDQEGLDRSYELHIDAYDRIFDRCGLEWHRVASDVGMMGGSGAHEYMAPCPAGENDVALAPGYAANVEVASADAQRVAMPAGLAAPESVHTPGMTTVDQVAAALEVPAGALLKAYPVVTGDDELRMVVVRGDHRVNEDGVDRDRLRLALHQHLALSLDRDAAVKHALQMIDEGAGIIDVGGESTRPGAEFVPEAEELKRVIGVIEDISSACDVPISIDTRNLGNITAVAAESLHDDDMFAANTVSDPERVGLKPNDTARLAEHEVRITLPPVSWTAMTLR